jgi:hypothetical protein
MIKPEDLIVNSRYQTAGGNTFCLELPFDANRVCFHRERDGQWHYGREFIEFRDGQTVLDLCAAPPPDTPGTPSSNQAQ